MDRKKWLLLSVCLGLCGCSDNGFLFRSVGSYDASQKGVYLIGEPYEINNVRYVPHEDYDYFDSGDAFWYTADKNNPLTANGEVFDPEKMTAMHRTLPLPSIVRITNLNNQTSAVVRVNDRGPFDNNRIIDVSEATARYLNFSRNGVTPVQIEILALESQALKKELIGETKKKTPVAGEVALDSNKILYPGLSAQEVQNLNLKKGGAGASSFNKVQAPAKEMTYYQLKKQENSIKETKAVSPATYNTQSARSDILYSGQDQAPKFYVQIGAFSKTDSVRAIQENLKGYPDLFVTGKRKENMLLHYVRIGPYKTEGEASNVLDKVHASGYADSVIIFE